MLREQCTPSYTSATPSAIFWSLESTIRRVNDTLSVQISLHVITSHLNHLYSRNGKGMNEIG